MKKEILTGQELLDHIRFVFDNDRPTYTWAAWVAEKSVNDFEIGLAIGEHKNSLYSAINRVWPWLDWPIGEGETCMLEIIHELQAEE